MTTVLSNARRSAPPRGTLVPLALISAKQYLRHPTYVLGATLPLVGAALRLFPSLSSEMTWDSALTYEVYLGIGGIFVGASLARRDDAADAIVASAPTTRSTRTLALFLACAVPAFSAAAIMATGAVVERWRPPAADLTVPLRPSTGPIGRIEYLAWLLELGPVAAFGGAALGVLVGRRVRTAGAGIAAAIGLVVAEFVSLGAAESIPGVGERWWARALANAMPYGYWQTDHVDPVTGDVGMRPGSPIGHVVYALALCGLVIIVGVTGAVDRRWQRAGIVVLAGVAAAGYTWALLG